MLGGIRPGYKQSDVGVIPDDWEVYELANLFQMKSGLAFSSDYYANSGPILLTPGNFSLDGRLVFTERNTKRFSGRYPKAAVFASGDLLVVMTDLTPDCNLLGKPAFLFDNETVLHNQRIGKVVLTSAKCQSEYLYRFFLSDAHAKRMKETATGSTVRHTSNRSIYGSRIALPPLPEQRAIAEALADADGLIAAVEGMIAKKRDLKQAAMQHLLTGKTRLPGFSGEWEVKRLGEIGYTYGGLTGKSKVDFGHGSARYITFMNIMTNVLISPNGFENVDVSASENQNRTVQGDLFFNGSSETPEEVGMCSLLAEEFENLYLNSFCFGFRLRDHQAASGLYLAYYFRSSSGRELLSSLAQGATRYNLSKRALMAVQVKLPTSEEQTAIAEVLADMDADLAALEAQAAKARAVKQGMMQELLTGRVRLV